MGLLCQGGVLGLRGASRWRLHAQNRIRVLGCDCYRAPFLSLPPRVARKDLSQVFRAENLTRGVGKLDRVARLDEKTVNAVSTTSGIPPTREATAGVAGANASMRTTPELSPPRLGRASILALRYSSIFTCSLTPPRILTLLEFEDTSSGSA